MTRHFRAIAFCKIDVSFYFPIDLSGRKGAELVRNSDNSAP